MYIPDKQPLWGHDPRDENRHSKVAGTTTISLGELIAPRSFPQEKARAVILAYVFWLRSQLNVTTVAAFGISILFVHTRASLLEILSNYILCFSFLRII